MTKAPFALAKEISRDFLDVTRQRWYILTKPRRPAR